MKIALGALITLAAASIGAMAGFVVVVVLCIPLWAYASFASFQQLESLSILIQWMAYCLPALGALLGIWFGWRLVLLSPNAVDEKRKCGNCDYDLYANQSSHCPECGREIPSWQQRHLKRLADSHA